MGIPAHIPAPPERLKAQFDQFFAMGGIRKAYLASHRGLPAGGLSPWGLTKVPFILLNVGGTIDIGYLDSSGTRRNIVLRAHEAIYFVAGAWMDCDNWQSDKYLRITVDNDHTLFGMQDRTDSFPWKDRICGSMELYACPKIPDRFCATQIGYLEELHENENSFKYRLINALSLLTLHLADMLSHPVPTRENGKAESTWMAVRGYVDEHCFDAGLSRKSIAKTFRITQSHISRLFADHGESAYQQYVERHRMVHARMLLVSSHLTVDEIAHACGFSGANYFVRVFRGTYGMPPAKYRAAVNR